MVAAKTANRGIASWRWLRKRSSAPSSTAPATRPPRRRCSFARQCRGSCRGPGGTAHSKFFLFDNVGAAPRAQRRGADLGEPHLDGLPGPVEPGAGHALGARLRDFYAIFRQIAAATAASRNPYHVGTLGQRRRTTSSRARGQRARLDPVMQILNRVSCHGATAGGTGGRTRIRIIQYAIYGDRGVWIAKKLRYLWEPGCDVAIIYSVSSRPVLSILRNALGPRPDPDAAVGHQGPLGQHREVQPQQVDDDHRPLGQLDRRLRDLQRVGQLGQPGLRRRRADAADLEPGLGAAPLAAFAKTWRQRTSQAPGSGRVVSFGRVAGVPTADIPEDVPACSMARRMTSTAASFEASEGANPPSSP